MSRHDSLAAYQEWPSPKGLEVVRTVYAPGFRSEWHDTAQAQLIYPSRGVMTLHTRSGLWVVPPLQGCWLPAFEEHRVETTSGLEMHSVYCAADSARLPDQCGIVTVSPLMRELILALAGTTVEEEASPRRRAIAWLLMDSIALQPQPRLFMPSLESARLARIAEALRTDPADSRTLQGWARELATTTRTLARAFEREGGMSFTAFRRQARLHAAMARLAAGDSVTATAHDLGFSSASNFIAMFRRATGLTPKACFAPPP